MAVIDWYSRKVLAWRVSNTLDGRFCVECLEQALRVFGIPEIFNTDQGCQFTSEAFTGVLKRHDIDISMDRYLLLQYLHSPHPRGLWTRASLG
jgi:putative transposase